MLNFVQNQFTCPFNHSKAMQKVDDVLSYYRWQPEATPENVSQLIKLREFCAKKREITIKQTSIFSYFSKNSNKNNLLGGICFLKNDFKLSQSFSLFLMSFFLVSLKKFFFFI